MHHSFDRSDKMLGDTSSVRGARCLLGFHAQGKTCNLRVAHAYALLQHGLMG